MKFSVIIPVYNKANTIRMALESVYQQTCQDFEIVLVDDGSKDDLESVLADIKTSKVNYIRQDNGGVSVARNTGIANAKGKFICFLDADDLWKPNHLEVLSKMIDEYPCSEVFVTSHEVILPNGRAIHSSVALKKYAEHFEVDDFLGLLNSVGYSIINTNCVCVSLKAIKRDAIFFEPGVKIGEDTDVWYRLGLKNKVAITRKETTVYRREFSTATKNGSHINDWVFRKRLPNILSDTEISDQAKKSAIDLVDRYILTCSREFMLIRNRKKARQILCEVKEKRGYRFFLTLLLTFLPHSICRKLLKRY